MTDPTLRIVIGTAGSGKSTTARRLAQRHRATYLDKDVMFARFVESALVASGHDPGDREGNSYYRDHILPMEYDSLLDVVGANLRLGLAVVVDAPFSPYLSDPDFITAAAQQFGWPHVDIEVVWVRVSPAILRERLRTRGLDRDHAKLDHWDDYWALHGGVRCAWAGVGLTEVLNDEPDPDDGAGTGARPVPDARDGRTLRSGLR